MPIKVESLGAGGFVDASRSSDGAPASADEPATVQVEGETHDVASPRRPGIHRWQDEPADPHRDGLRRDGGAGVFSLRRGWSRHRHPRVADRVGGCRRRHADARVRLQNLAIRKPDLDSGVFIYAKAGFGDYAGFNSAIGFWASAVAGNTFYWVFIGATLGAFFDGFGEGNTILAMALSTAGVWLFHILIARGIRDAAIIEPDRHGVQDPADPGVHRRALRLARRGCVRRQLDRLRVRRLGEPRRPGAQHDDHHDVRLPRHRGRERLLPLREEPRGRRQGDGAGLPQRAVAVRPRDAVQLRGGAAARARRHSPAVDGRCVRVGGR